MSQERESLLTVAMNGASPAMELWLEYEEWEAAHASMKTATPREGRDYLKHAKNLLYLLQGLAELHPIAKAVVSTFETVILFEDVRRANDIRVAAVFLAQADTLRFLIHIDRLPHRRPDDAGSGDKANSNPLLVEALYRIQKDIKACGNSIDTYYKESRFVKFWKAQDWKERLLSYVAEFNEHRTLLQQALSVQIASGVSDIVSKMDKLLSSVFDPTSEWEQRLILKTRQLGAADTWMQDTDTLNALLSSSEEYSGAGVGSDAQLQKIRTELSLSLDVLCERNEEIFDLKLNLHSENMQDAISRSAHHIVKSLSGPYDRLRNEDLRELWKEMNWIFCVPNDLFTSALHEYYRDKFASAPYQEYVRERKSKSESSAMEKETQENINSSGSSSRPPVSYDDSWTLSLLSQYGEHIALSIDKDRSGYIRISEANAFTDSIPDGWTLPQWCAYMVAGWPYEERIYRKRMQDIVFKSVELQPEVLSANRLYLIVLTMVAAAETQQLWRPPQGLKQPPVAYQLCGLVYQKMLNQDRKTRDKLSSLKWTIEDESVIDLLYPGMGIEWYSHQYGYVLLEHFFQVMQVGCTQILDYRDLLQALSGVVFLRTIITQRVVEAERYLHDNVITDPIGRRSAYNHHAGTWSYFDQTLQYAGEPNGQPARKSIQLAEIVDHSSDISVLSYFPIASLPLGTLPYLKYQTWENHIKTLKAEEIPAHIPPMWALIEEVDLDLVRGSALAERPPLSFPYIPEQCNKCHQHPLYESLYACLECDDFNLCSMCFSSLDADIEKHCVVHSSIRVCLSLPEVQQDWLFVAAKEHLKRTQQSLFWAQRHVATDADVAVEEANDWEKPQAEALSGQESAGEEEQAEEDKDEVERRDDPTNPSTEKFRTETPSIEDSPPTNDALPLEDAQLSADTAFPEEDTFLVDNSFSRALFPLDEAVITWKCGRCSTLIRDESTIRRCFGHDSCHDYYVCSACVLDDTVQPGDEHRWWHTLLVFRKSVILAEPPSRQIEAPKVTTEQESSVIARLAVVEELLNARCSLIEEKLGTTQSALEAATSRMEEKLDDRITTLEDKIQIDMEELKKLLGDIMNKVASSA